MFIPQADESDMNMNTDTCSFHQFVMILAHFQPSTNKTQDTDINSRHEIINCHYSSHQFKCDWLWSLSGCQKELLFLIRLTKIKMGGYTFTISKQSCNTWYVMKATFILSVFNLGRSNCFRRKTENYCKSNIPRYE